MGLVHIYIWTRLLQLWSGVLLSCTKFMICSWTSQLNAGDIWSTAVINWLDITLLDMKTVWVILDMLTSLEAVTVGLCGQHLRWYSWKMLFIRRRYRKDVRKNCVFCITLLNIYSMARLSVRMKYYWILLRMREGVTCYHLMNLIVVTFQRPRLVRYLTRN